MDDKKTLRLWWLLTNELLILSLIVSRIEVSLIFYAIFLTLSIIILVSLEKKGSKN